MRITKGTGYRTSLVSVNKMRKDADIKPNGQIKDLCIDGRAHNFVQIKNLNQYNNTYCFIIPRLVKRKFIDGTKYTAVDTTKSDKYTRVFCKKCTLSTVVLVKKEEEYDGN